MRSLGWTGVLIKWGEMDTETARDKAEIRVMDLKPRDIEDCQKVTRGQGTGWTRFTPTASEGANPANIWFLDIWPQQLRQISVV